MVERLFNIKLYRHYEPMKTLNDIDLTLHMEPYETGKENSDED